MRSRLRFSLRWQFLGVLGLSIVLSLAATLFIGLCFEFLFLLPWPFRTFAVWANHYPGWLGIAFMLLDLVLLGLFFVGLSQGILTRFQVILQAIRRIAGGEQGVRVREDRRGDELGLLAGDINAMAEQLQKSAAEERRAVQAKDDLIAGISHDLRTPLTSILGYLTLMTDGLERGAPLPEIKSHAAVAYRKARQLKDLVDALFDFTRLGERSFRLQNREVDLVELLGQLVEEFQPALEEAGKTCVLSSSEPKISAVVDPGLLVRALQNLLTNAIRYSEERGQVGVAIDRVEGVVAIRISNHGRTIPGSELERIFDRFFRGAAPASGGGDSAGLGLAIARQIVVLHGGEISAASEAGSTVFTVSLPDKMAPADS